MRRTHSHPPCPAPAATPSPQQHAPPPPNAPQSHIPFRSDPQNYAFPPSFTLSQMASINNQQKHVTKTTEHLTLLVLHGNQVAFMKPPTPQ